MATPMHLTRRERSLQHLVTDFAFGTDAVEVARQNPRNNWEFGDKRAQAAAYLAARKAEQGIS